MKLTEDVVKAFFTIAGIEVVKVDKIANKYWPEAQAYAEVREANPWWLVHTPYGVIEIGNRKRVTFISWELTQLRKVITEDDVTKEETFVHAWTTEKITEYLCTLARELDQIQTRYVLQDYQGKTIATSSTLELIEIAVDDAVFIYEDRAPVRGEMVKVGNVATLKVHEIIFKSDRTIEFYVHNSSYANYVKYYLIDKLKQFKV